MEPRASGAGQPGQPEINTPPAPPTCGQSAICLPTGTKAPGNPSPRLRRRGGHGRSPSPASRVASPLTRPLQARSSIAMGHAALPRIPGARGRGCRGASSRTETSPGSRCIGRGTARGAEGARRPPAPRSVSRGDGSAWPGPEPRSPPSRTIEIVDEAVAVIGRTRLEPGPHARERLVAPLGELAVGDADLAAEAIASIAAEEALDHLGVAVAGWVAAVGELPFRPPPSAPLALRARFADEGASCRCSSMESCVVPSSPERVTPESVQRDLRPACQARVTRGDGGQRCLQVRRARGRPARGSPRIRRSSS